MRSEAAVRSVWEGTLQGMTGTYPPLDRTWAVVEELAGRLFCLCTAFFGHSVNGTFKMFAVVIECDAAAICQATDGPRHLAVKGLLNVNVAGIFEPRQMR